MSDDERTIHALVAQLDEMRGLLIEEQEARAGWAKRAIEAERAVDELRRAAETVSGFKRPDLTGIESLRRQVIGLAHDFDATTKELTATRAQLVERVETHRREVERLHFERETMRADVSEARADLTAEVARSDAAVSELRETLTEVEQQRDALRAEVETLTRERDEAEAHVASVSEQALQRVIERQWDEMREARAEVERLKADKESILRVLAAKPSCVDLHAAFVRLYRAADEAMQDVAEHLDLDKLGGCVRLCTAIAAVPESVKRAAVREDGEP